MKDINRKKALSFVLAFVMTVSLCSSLMVHQTVQAAEPQAVTLDGVIAWQPISNTNREAALVYMSNAATVAQNCSWYNGIYNGTNKVAKYFTGQVQVEGKNYTTSVWVPGDAGNSGAIQFNLGTGYTEKVDFVIPAGTVFTCTDEGYTDQTIIFEEEYLFDVSMGLVYPTGSNFVQLNPGSITWQDTNKALVTIRNAAELAKNCAWYSPIYNGTATESLLFAGTLPHGGQRRNCQIWIPYNSSTNGYIRFEFTNYSYDKTDFTIPAGTVFTLKDSAGNLVAGERIVFTEEYVFDVSNGVVYPKNISSQTMSLYKYSWGAGGNITGFQIGNIVDLPPSWHPATEPAESARPTFQGEVQVNGAETKSVKMDVPGNGEVFLYFGASGITSGTVTIPAGTMFYPTKNATTAVTFDKAYTFDISNKTLNYDTYAHDITLQTGRLSMVDTDVRKREIYLSNASELAGSADWYKTIYDWSAQQNQTEPEVIYLSGKVMLNGEGTNAEIAIYGVGQTTGRMHIEVYGNNYDGISSYVIPKGTVFTKVTGRDGYGFPIVWDETVQIQFSTAYLFDINSEWVYPLNADIQQIVLSGYDTDASMTTADSVHVWSDLSGITWIPTSSESPVLNGTVEVDGVKTSVTLQIASRTAKTVLIQSGSADITTDYVLKRDTVFVSSDGRYGIRVPRDYTVSRTNKKVTHEQDVVELDATWMDSTNRRFHTTVKNTDMEEAYWYTSTGESIADASAKWSIATGTGKTNTGASVDVTVKVHQDGVLFFYYPENVTSIEFPKGTVFTFNSISNDANVDPGTDVVTTFELASNYKFDVTNATLIHKEEIGIQNIAWKGWSPAGYHYLTVNIDVDKSSFEDLIWYQEFYNKVATEQIIVDGNALLGISSNPTTVSMQVQDLGRFTFQHEGVLQQRFEIMKDTCFSKDYSNNGNKKRYEFTFADSYELDAVTGYIGAIGGQSDAPGNSNGDANVNVIDLVHMAKFNYDMEHVFQDDMRAWGVSYGADANKDGWYNDDDTTAIMKVLVGLDPTL